MDVYCASCSEPWESYHMLHDEPWEAWDGVEESYSHNIVKEFLEGPRNSISKELREALEHRGWKFGKTVVCILECPCCLGDSYLPEDEATERKNLKLEAEDLMAGDLDGIVSVMSKKNL